MSKQEKINKIIKEIKGCKKCGLHKEAQNAVAGEGSLNAEIVFVGEAPGFNEDKQGKPFVGRAGKILDELLESINFSRNDIYITNIIKHRPPKNRNPTNEEIIACGPYLDKQLGIIQPKIICCLGNFSTKYIFEKYGLKDNIQGITKIHGKIFKVSTLVGTLKIMPLFHPAVATYNPRKIDVLKKDFQILKEVSKK